MIPLPSTFCSRRALSTITDNDLLLVVSRGSTQSEKTQIADLLSGTMRRISRARSIVSGVELWHPTKPLLENRVEFVHCIVIIMHCLRKTISQSPFCFLKRPIFIQMQSPASGLFLFECYRFAKASFLINQIFKLFLGGSQPGPKAQPATSR